MYCVIYYVHNTQVQIIVNAKLEIKKKNNKKSVATEYWLILTLALSTAQRTNWNRGNSLSNDFQIYSMCRR